MDICLCDMCLKETGHRDMRILRLEDRLDNPKMIPKDICVFCAEKVKAKISEMMKEPINAEAVS